MTTEILTDQYAQQTKAMSSGHQLFGIILFVLILFQFGIGYYHHLRYRKYQRPTLYGKVHLYVGPAMVLGGIINGFTGFNLSGNPGNNLFYGIIVAVIIVTVLIILGWKRWSKRKQSKGLARCTSEEGGEVNTSYEMYPPGNRQ
jgi:uncharacterized protein YacL